MTHPAHTAPADAHDAAARAAYEIFTTPRRHARPEREHQWLAGARRFSIPFDDGDLPAWSWGPLNAPAVLLVHGWEGRGSQLGGFVQPLLARGNRVIAIDMPAHGDAPGERATPFDFADAIAATASAVRSLHAIIAHSFGAAAVNIALARGLEVERVVYVAPLVVPRIVFDRFVTFMGLHPVAISAFEKLLRDHGGEPIDDADGLALAGDQTAALLVVHDRGDKEMPLAPARALVAAWSGAELVTTSGLGHRRILRDADTVERVARHVHGQSAREPSETEIIERDLFDREARRRRAFPG